jgi:hypothetical protein
MVETFTVMPSPVYLLGLDQDLRESRRGADGRQPGREALPRLP